MNEQEAIWFPSKVDAWLGILLALMPLLPVITLVAAVLDNQPGAWVSVLLALILPAIYAGLLFPMRYGVSADTLIVRNGLMRQRIPLRSILEVRPTRSPLSSPALSLDRLNVQYGKRFFRRVMISPAEREEFLLLLAARGRLERRGAALIRPEAAAD